MARRLVVWPQEGLATLPGEVQLVGAVVRQAIADATAPLRTGTSTSTRPTRRQRYQARVFLNASPDLLFLCGLMGADVEAIVPALRHALAKKGVRWHASV